MNSRKVSDGTIVRQTGKIESPFKIAIGEYNVLNDNCCEVEVSYKRCGSIICKFYFTDETAPFFYSTDDLLFIGSSHQITLSLSNCANEDVADAIYTVKEKKMKVTNSSIEPICFEVVFEL